MEIITELRQRKEDGKTITTINPLNQEARTELKITGPEEETTTVPDSTGIMKTMRRVAIGIQVRPPEVIVEVRWAEVRQVVIMDLQDLVTEAEALPEEVEDSSIN